MKTAILVFLFFLVAVVMGWHIFEHIWDRKLFVSETTINLDTDETREWLAESDEVQIVDVRPVGSYEAGHLSGAVNVKHTGGQLDPAVANLDPGKPVLVYCDGGFRSRMAISAFEDAGFREIRHLHRGIMAWKLKGGEVEKD